jgi:hypothetical protein
MVSILSIPTCIGPPFLADNSQLILESLQDNGMTLNVQKGNGQCVQNTVGYCHHLEEYSTLHQLSIIHPLLVTPPWPLFCS